MNHFFEWEEEEYEITKIPDTEEEKIEQAIRRENRYILYWKIGLCILGIITTVCLIKC